MGRRGAELRTARPLIVLLAVLSALLTVTASAQANGVAFGHGDVLADVGNGQIRHFTNTGTLVDTLATTTGTTEGDGMCLDSSLNLYATQGFSADTVSKFDANGNLLTANFGSGYDGHPESCAVDQAGNVYVGQPDGSHAVLKFNSAGTLLATYTPAVESRGTDWIDLAHDQCTLHYTSEASSIKQFNVCTNTQLPDFATNLPGGSCYGHRILPDGGELVACSSQIDRVNASGAVTQTYTLPGASLLFAINLDPDGTSFWTADYTAGQIWRVDIASGNVITTFTSAPNTVMGGLAIVGEPTAAGGVTAPPVIVSPGSPAASSSTSASDSGQVNPGGLVTTAYYQFGIDKRYLGSGVSGAQYDQQTAPVSLAAGTSPQTVSATLTNLVPNALYHIRLVATNSLGTVFGPDQTFMTRADPAPSRPVLGRSENFIPVSGLVFVKPPSGASLTARGAHAITKGQGFVPLTEARQLPNGTEVDGRAGSLKIVTAPPTGRAGKLQFGVFAGALYSVNQVARGVHKGLTTLKLLQGIFPGAPSFAACGAKAIVAGSGLTAIAASYSQFLRASAHGSYRTSGHYSASTVRGTVWDMIDRCGGTLTVVHRGIVAVHDFVRRKTVLVHAGHHYLARKK
jgi:hypothetical protein